MATQEKIEDFKNLKIRIMNALEDCECKEPAIRLKTDQDDKYEWMRKEMRARVVFIDTINDKQIRNEIGRKSAYEMMTNFNSLYEKKSNIFLKENKIEMFENEKNSKVEKSEKEIEISSDKHYTAKIYCESEKVKTVAEDSKVKSDLNCELKNRDIFSENENNIKVSQNNNYDNEQKIKNVKTADQANTSLNKGKNLKNVSNEENERVENKNLILSEKYKIEIKNSNQNGKVGRNENKVEKCKSGDYKKENCDFEIVKTEIKCELKVSDHTLENKKYKKTMIIEETNKKFIENKIESKNNKRGINVIKKSKLKINGKLVKNKNVISESKRTKSKEEDKIKNSEKLDKKVKKRKNHMGLDRENRFNRTKDGNGNKSQADHTKGPRRRSRTRIKKKKMKMRKSVVKNQKIIESKVNRSLKFKGGTVKSMMSECMIKMYGRMIDRYEYRKMVKFKIYGELINRFDYRK